MIINAPIPGQEERNADYLLEQGVALKAFDAVTLSYRVRYLLENPKHLQEMTEKASQIGKPHAGKHVITNVLGHRLWLNDERIGGLETASLSRDFNWVTIELIICSTKNRSFS